MKQQKKKLKESQMKKAKFLKREKEVRKFKKNLKN